MTTTPEYVPIEKTAGGKKAAGPVGWLDERLGLAGIAKKNLRKVFPEHWSFMLGEIALWSFVILLITGVFLTFWYQPSMAEVEYAGPYVPLNGLEMSQAYESTLKISFEIRGGLLIRQIHHWAAMLFIAAMIVHMLRVFFTGAYRKPREINWLIGLGLLTLQPRRPRPPVAEQASSWLPSLSSLRLSQARPSGLISPLPSPPALIARPTARMVPEAPMASCQPRRCRPCSMVISSRRAAV